MSGSHRHASVSGSTKPPSAADPVTSHRSDSFIDAWREITDAVGTEATLLAVTQSAVDCLERVDYASINVWHSTGQLVSIAPTDELAVGLDVLQHTLHEGPCYEAANEEVVESNDVATDNRWPSYGPEALSLGVHAQTAFQLRSERAHAATLNLYSRRIGPIEVHPQLIDLFASQASLVLGYTRQVDSLTQALLFRKQIGQAMGILMERYSLSEDEAFAYLKRMSQDSTTKLTVVCTELIAATKTMSSRKG